MFPTSRAISEGNNRVLETIMGIQNRNETRVVMGTVLEEWNGGLVFWRIDSAGNAAFENQEPVGRIFQ
jgi:hypothetical protein